MNTSPHPQRILVIDIGGSNVKLLATGEDQRIKFPSARDLTPTQLVEQVKAATSHWQYDAISLGCPCVVSNNRPIKNPHNLGDGWIGFDFQQAFGIPTKVINDATMQAIGCYQGGTMLFLGFGTGLGTTLIKDTDTETAPSVSSVISSWSAPITPTVTTPTPETTSPNEETAVPKNKTNNGMGNNADGVDVSNPGKAAAVWEEKFGIVDDTSVDDESKATGAAPSKNKTR